jgi:hypothetical protein
MEEAMRPKRHTEPGLPKMKFIENLQIKAFLMQHQDRWNAAPEGRRKEFILSLTKVDYGQPECTWPFSKAINMIGYQLRNCSGVWDR